MIAFDCQASVPLKVCLTRLRSGREVSFVSCIDKLLLRSLNLCIMLKMAGSGYRRFARSRLYEYILVVMRFYYCI